MRSPSPIGAAVVALCVAVAIAGCGGGQEQASAPTPTAAPAPASPSPADTTPPSTPTGLSATAISSTQINLAWTASTDNVGATGYRLFRGGTQIASVTSGTAYQNTGLSPGTPYTYTVSAYDAAGNTSAYSATASATTGAGGGTQTTGGVNWLDPLQYQKPAFVSIAVPDEATVVNKYYVDMSAGSGSTCSQSSPCASIDNVIGKPGTTGGPAYIYIRGTGDWSGYNDTFYGAPGNEIVIKPWGTATATFTGNSNASSASIHDLIFDGGPDLGMTFRSDITNNYNFHVMADNVTVYRTRSFCTAGGNTLFAVGDFGSIDNVKFINNEMYGCNQSSGSQTSAVYVGPGDGGGYSNFVFKNNIVREMGGEGIEINPRVTSNNIEISGNAIHNVGKQTCFGSWNCRPGITMSVQSGGGNNGTVIKNNLIWDTGSGCIWDRGGGTPRPVIYNNTCFDYGKDPRGIPSPSDPWPNGIAGYSGPGTAIVSNNIIYAPNGINPLDGAYIGSNNLCGPGKSCGASSTVWSANTVLSTNENTSNFLQIGNNSEAVNTGATISSITTDYAGVLRPQGPAWDIGAYERQ